MIDEPKYIVRLQYEDGHTEDIRFYLKVSAKLFFWWMWVRWYAFTLVNDMYGWALRVRWRQVFSMGVRILGYALAARMVRSWYRQVRDGR